MTEQRLSRKFDDFFLSQKIEESRQIVKEVLQISKKPLIIQFSGGKDSMVLVRLVQEITDKFICGYMMSGIEFPEAIEFVSKTANELRLPLVFSNPSDHKGDFFERLNQFRRWPTVRAQWCNRDLKIRPQKKILNQIYGKGSFYKLNGVRRYESIRRRAIYPPRTFIKPDNQVAGDFVVLPLLHWTDADVSKYLEFAGLPMSKLYKRYGVSGCYWCPFYQPEIYKKILKDEPNLYDEFIKWEIILNQPSVIGHIYLRDLKEEMAKH